MDVATLIHWGQGIGAATVFAISRLLAANKHSEHGYGAWIGADRSLRTRYARQQT
jgi:hypothetical protein